MPPTATDAYARRPCLLCGRDDTTLLFKTSTPAHDILRCTHCRLVFRRDPHAPSYDHEHYEKQDYGQISSTWVNGRKAVFAPRLSRLDTHRQNGRLLDVGAGHGFFLAACQDRGWEVHGIEIARQAADFAAEVLALNLQRRPLDEIGYEDHFFDIITYWNVLDQLPDPLQALRESLRILRPGGALIIRVPNASFHVPVRRFFSALGPLKKMDVTVFHLYSLSRTTILSLLEQAGFSHIRLEVAPLVWTSSHGASDSFLKRLVNGAVQSMAHLFFALSFHHSIISPSIIVEAKKTSEAL